MNDLSTPAASLPLGYDGADNLRGKRIRTCISAGAFCWNCPPSSRSIFCTPPGDCSLIDTEMPGHNRHRPSFLFDLSHCLHTLLGRVWVCSVCHILYGTLRGVAKVLKHYARLTN